MEQAGFAIIGTGIVGGEWHAQSYSRLPHAKLVAVCDLNEDRANEVAQKYGAEKVYTDYKDMLQNPDIHAVSIATPDFAHREFAVAAAEAGKHILVEKPIATTVEDGEAILAAAKQAGVKLMVCYHNRVNPPFANAKLAISSGEIGKPTYVYARLSNTTFVATQMLSWGSKTSALWFLASHITDMATWLIDDEPVRVYALNRSGILKGMGVDTEDLHVAMLEFRNGAVATLENAWFLPETEPMVFNFKFEILGDKGSIYINSSDHRLMEQYTTESASLPDVTAITPTGDNRLSGFVLEAVARFVDTVVYDRPVLATGEEALQVTRILVAMNESAAKGQPVDL